VEAGRCYGWGKAKAGTSAISKLQPLLALKWAKGKTAKGNI
jgi:hypothetical protein